MPMPSQLKIKKFFPNCLFWLSGKRPLGPFLSGSIWFSRKRFATPNAHTRERASFPRARKALGEEFFLFFCPIFCEAFPHYLKLFIQIWDNFDFFIYFVIFCLVEFFAYFKFELQVYEIMTLLNQKMIFMIFGWYFSAVVQGCKQNDMLK